MTTIVEATPDERQTLLFSATIDESIQKNLGNLLKNPAVVEIAHKGETAKTVDQYMMPIKQDKKPELLRAVLEEKGHERVIVFARTRNRAEDFAKALNDDGYQAESIHSDKSVGARRRALDKFRRGKANILVATDVLARGIDVPSVDYVINLDLPDCPEDYVHRIGRTGRAGSHGLAIMLATREDGRLVDAIEKLTKQTFEQKPLRPLSRQARSEMRRASGERPERRGEREIERVDTPEDERLAKERARAYVPPSHRNRDPIFDTPYRERSGASGKPEELRVFERETVRKPRQAAVLLCGFPRRRD